MAGLLIFLVLCILPCGAETSNRQRIIALDSEIYQENKNVITRAIGVYDSVSADLFEVELKPGDTFLLCSDGLTNLVSDADIEKVLTSPLSLEEKCMLLIDIGLEAGGMDNISVILVDPEISEVRAC
jgi:protein phosphatase